MLRISPGTARGSPMVAHEWLSQAIYHGVVEVGGLLSLRALHAALAVAILLFLFASLRRERVPPALALFSVLLYVAIAQARLLDDACELITSVRGAFSF